MIFVTLVSKTSQVHVVREITVVLKVPDGPKNALLANIVHFDIMTYR